MNEFDKYACNYDDKLDDLLISTVGADSTYFSEYKAKEVKKYYQNTSPKNILDFGCGVGNNSIYLSKYFPRSNIYGIDISELSIRQAKKRNIQNCKFFRYDGYKIEFQDNFFDMIFISNVFHHIDHNFHIDTLTMLRSKLANNGKMFLFEHNTLNPITRKIVKECEFDKDATLLNFWYTRSILKKTNYKNQLLKFIMFIPPSWKKFTFIEKYFGWLPFGGQYYIKAEK